MPDGQKGREGKESVGVKGFEPSTSSSRTTRATGLRYTPFSMLAVIQ